MATIILQRYDFFSGLAKHEKESFKKTLLRPQAARFFTNS